MPTSPKQYRRPGWAPPEERRPHWHKWYCLKAWKTRRLHHLAKQPLCVECERHGVMTPATDVDHVQDHKGDWMAFIAGKLQSLCKTCHGSKTYREQTTRRPQSGQQDRSEHDDITTGRGQI